MTATVTIQAGDHKAVDVLKWFGGDNDRKESYHICPGAKLTIVLFGDQDIRIEETDRQVVGPVNDGVGG